MTKHSVILEESTNTHVAEIHATKQPKVRKFHNGEMVVKLEDGMAVVSHGEHGCIVENQSFHKINQMELNPVSRMFQQVVD